MLRAILADHRIELHPGDAMLDWGCSTGRVLRRFRAEAEWLEAWGADQQGDAIAWAKQCLSPPFRFLTCTAYPHLPFEDRKFRFIYGLSVFTHIEHLIDLWLMEIRRILRPGGLAVFTVQDEHSAAWFREHGRESWIPEDFDLSIVEDNEITVLRGVNWGDTHTFFRTDWIERDWGHYLEIVEIRPLAEKYQSAVVLRRPQA